MKKVKNFFNKLFPCFAVNDSIVDLAKIKELEDAGVEPVFILTNKREVGFK